MEKKAEMEGTKTFAGKKVFDGFGSVVVVPGRNVKPHNDANRFKVTYSVRPKKDDPTRTEVYEAKRENIDELIQANADKVGIKAMLRAVQLGEITLNSLADDGQGGIDDRAFAGYVPPLSALNARSKDVIEKYKEAIPGIDASNFEQMITDLVNKKLEEAKAAQKVEKKESE